MQLSRYVTFSWYLAGRRFSLEGQHKAGISLLEESLKSKSIETAEANELIEIETQRLLGRLYLRLRNFKDARNAYQQVLARSTSEAARRTAKDWLQRVQWLASQSETGKN